MYERLRGSIHSQDLPTVFLKGRRRNLKPGNSFYFSEGENRYHGIAKGTVGILITNGHGQRALTYIGNTGDFCDPSVFNIHGYNVMVEALTNSVLYTRIVDIVKEEKKTKLAFVDMQLKIIKAQTELQQVFMLGQVPERLAYTVSKIGVSQKLEGQDVLQVTTSQVLLAEMVGHSRPMVNQTISKWRKRQVLLTQDKSRSLYFKKKEMDRYIRRILSS